MHNKSSILPFLVIILVLSLLIPTVRANPDIVFTDGFEDQTFDKWDQNGATNWLIGLDGSGTGGSASPHGGGYMAWSDETRDGDLISDDIDLSSASAVSLSIWIYKDDTEGTEFVLYYWDGVQYDQIVDFDSLGSDDVWIEYAVSIASEYWISGFRLRINSGVDKNENVYIDDIVIDKTIAGEEYSRTATQSISFSSGATSLFDLTREVSQSIGTSLDVTRLIDVTRTTTQEIGIGLETNRILGVIKSVTQAINILASTNGFGEFTRMVSQSISINLQNSRLIEILRSASQSIRITQKTNRFMEAIRSASQSINIMLDGIRIVGFERQVSQNIGFSLGTNRLQEIFRTVSQSIFFSVQGIAEIAGAAIRNVGLTISIKSGSGRLSDIFRDVAQAIDISFSASKIGSFIRTATQSISVAIQNSNLREISRNVNLIIGISLGTDRMIDIFRAVDQVIGIMVDGDVNSPTDTDIINDLPEHQSGEMIAPIGRVRDTWIQTSQLVIIVVSFFFISDITSGSYDGGRAKTIIGLAISTGALFILLQFIEGVV